MVPFWQRARCPGVGGQRCLVQLNRMSVMRQRLRTPMTQTICPNSLAGFEADRPDCPVCERAKRLSRPMPVFDDAARAWIRDGGGIFHGIFPIPNEHAFLVACETLVFVFDTSTGCRWRSGVLGLLDEVRLTNAHVEIESGGALERFSLLDGAAA